MEPETTQLQINRQVDHMLQWLPAQLLAAGCPSSHLRRGLRTTSKSSKIEPADAALRFLPGPALSTRALWTLFARSLVKGGVADPRRFQMLQTIVANTFRPASAWSMVPLEGFVFHVIGGMVQTEPLQRMQREGDDEQRALARALTSACSASEVQYSNQ